MKIKFGDNSLNLKVDGSLANIDRGPRGYSAYEIAVQEGFVGTEEEWLASLVGPEGKQGKDGERGIQGPRGQQGEKGEKGDTGPQGEKGDRGDTGPQGDKGDIGPQGEKGDTGPSNVLSIGSVTKGDEANATITGESPNQILNLVLPKGDKGEKGEKGDTGPQGETGPRGQQGDKGDKGDTGPQGETGEKGDTGPQGETGATGNGILSIQKTATAGLVDTYTTTFTDGTTTTFDVTNGEDGEVTQKQLDETNENVSWLQTLTDQMPTVSGQGTDISLQNVYNYRLMKFLPQGVSSQFSTTGKNLLNSITDTTTRNGITFTKNSDGTYTLNGTSTSDIDFNIASDIPLDLNTSYILSGSPNTASNTTYRIMGACTRENDSTTYIADNDGSGVTIPSSKKIRVYINVKNGKTLNNVIFKPMIRLESITDDTYEPYTDGPAPNPDYPYPVKSVTGENSLIICNENLFSTTWQQGAINTNTGVNYNNPDVIRTQGFLYVTPNQHYSFCRSKIGGYVNLRCYDNNKNYIGTGTVGANLIQGNTLAQPMGNNDYSCILSFKENVRYVRLMDSTNDLTTQYTMVKGDTPLTSYVANQTQTYQLSLGNIELCSTPDGTIRDYIYGTPDNWYKREYIGKVVLDGVNNAFATKSNTNANKVYFTGEISNIVVPSSNNNLGKGLSSHFKLNTAQNVYANDLIGFGIRIDNKINYGFGASSDLTSLALANQWLQEQYNNGTPVTTYYLHVNYVDIPITDTTLINQLNNIYNNAHSYNGVTNITTTYEEGNEQMYLDIEALAKEDIPDLTDYVKNTNYASSSKGGVIKTGWYNFQIESGGHPYTSNRSYNNYLNDDNLAFISKGTLENVITGKNLADKNYVDTAIATAITSALGGSY